MAELANQEDAVELLIDAARYGDLEDVRAAVEQYKVSADATDAQKRTALHMASANGHFEIVKFLLDKGANPEAVNDQQNTALHWACLNGQEQVVQLLMENGASPSIMNEQGRTPVDEALGRPHQDAILKIITGFGRVTDRLDEDDDPENEEMEVEDASAANQEAEEQDPALRPYDKYGTSRPR